MKKWMIIIFIFTAAFLLLQPLWGGLLISGVLKPSLTQEKAERYLQKYQEEFVLVRDYLLESDYAGIYIPDIDGTMSAGLEYGDVAIGDEEVSDTIKFFRQKFSYASVIGKEDNYIYFQIWALLRDKSRGIVYSIDSKEPVLQIMTKIEPLSEENWYYYEQNYDQWKANQPEEGS